MDPLSLTDRESSRRLHCHKLYRAIAWFYLFCDDNVSIKTNGFVLSQLGLRDAYLMGYHTSIEFETPLLVDATHDGEEPYGWVIDRIQSGEIQF